MRKKIGILAVVLVLVAAGAGLGYRYVRNEQRQAMQAALSYDAFCYNGQLYLQGLYRKDYYTDRHTQFLRPVALENGWQSAVWATMPQDAEYKMLVWNATDSYTYLKDGTMLLTSGNKLLLYSLETGAKREIWRADRGNEIIVDDISPDKDWVALRCAAGGRYFSQRLLLNLETGETFSNPDWALIDPCSILGQQGDTLYCNGPATDSPRQFGVNEPFSIFGLNTTTGEETVLAEGASDVAEGAMLNGNLYYIKGKRLRELNLKTGETAPLDLDLSAYESLELLNLESWKGWLLLSMESEGWVHLLLIAPGEAQVHELASWPVENANRFYMRVSEDVVTITNGYTLYTYLLPGEID